MFCQCKQSKPNTDDCGQDYPSLDTFLSIDVCMGLMNKDPQKAHQMLDSLRAEELMTQARCDYYHAIILYNGEDIRDSALIICDRLLDENNYGDDRYLEEEICVLASNITTVTNHHLETLRYANRGIAICHGNEQMANDEATLMARVGVAEHGLGRIEQARETYARAYKLLKGYSSFGDLIALISLQKKQAELCKETNEYDKAIETYHEILSLVERFDRDPSFVEQRPHTMQKSGDGTHDFANFYKCQIYGHIARTFRLKIEEGRSDNLQADKDSVSTYIDKWSSTEGSQSPGNLANTLHEMYFLGRKAEFDRAKNIVAEAFASDSLNTEYVDYLTLMAEDAISSKDYKASTSYLQRAVVVGDSIRQQELMRSLSEQMSINMVQEQQLARQDAENLLERHKLFNILLSVILCTVLIAALIIALLIRRNLRNEHIIEVTQQNLTESKQEIEELTHELEETKAEQVIKSTQALYDRIVVVMADEKLYLDPDLDIYKLADAVGSSRSIVSSCINTITGNSFRVWLGAYRLSLFEKMLQNEPDAPIDVLIALCGYKDQSTFRRQFKKFFGITAGEYRRQLQDNLNPDEPTEVESSEASEETNE